MTDALSRRDARSDRARAELRLHVARQDAYYADRYAREHPGDYEARRLLTLALSREDAATAELRRAERETERA